MNVNCIVPVEKFRDYVLKPGADQGKLQVFLSLGYTQEHSEQLAAIYKEKAAEQYARGNYLLGRKDSHGQRIIIEIILEGINGRLGKKSYLSSGWMIIDAETIKLNTPFAGFSRSRE